MRMKRKRVDGSIDSEDIPVCSPLPSSSQSPHTSTELSALGSDSVLSQPMKKKKLAQLDFQKICDNVYEALCRAKAADGHSLCEAFVRVPKRRTAADYYDVISTPIDLLKIQQKIKTEEYDDVEHLTSDVQLMVNNAKAYYKDDSQEYHDACQLWNIFEEVKIELFENFGASSEQNHLCSGNEDKSFFLDSDSKGFNDLQVQSDDLMDFFKSTAGKNSDVKNVEEEDICGEVSAHEMFTESSNSAFEEVSECDVGEYEQLFAAVLTARDGDRNISDIFYVLPSKIKYPQYYEVIRSPIDLKMIALRIRESKYESLDDLERDLSLMIRNAQTYNDPKSVIFKDACTLKKLITSKKHELEYRRKGVVKSSERLRSKERINVQRLSAVCTALKYQFEDDDSTTNPMDFNGGDSDHEYSDSPFWQLFSAVKKYVTPDGDDISQPFCKLPSKKFYPDYYKEIKQPMSLNNVRKRIKAGYYETLRDCALDIDRIFYNARKYNQDESQIYKDACILQNVLIEKKCEIEKGSVLVESPFSEVSKTAQGDKIYEEDPVYVQGFKSCKYDLDCKRKMTRKGQDDGGLRKRINTLFKTAYEYTDVNGRMLRSIFIGLPSRIDYPDYYRVITNPIDITMIEVNIKDDKYSSEEALLNDFELMLNNALHYNEEGSVVYQDAKKLDLVLKTKWKSMSQYHASAVKRAKSKTWSPLRHNLQYMYESVRDCHDNAGRVLSTPFIKLPLKSDYPDYYEVIKKPMDMQRIQQKLLIGQYGCLDDMVTDFVMMFDNACKYNEPESVLYKDALVLQRTIFEKKMELTQTANDVPDVRLAIQELLLSLFNTTVNAEDEDGRCYSDSFGELQGLRAHSTSNVDHELGLQALTFDKIKKNVDKGRYSRLDRFQQDMFNIFETACKATHPDSQLYEDSVEMQLFFIKTRDAICKNGELLLTPALSYTERHLQQDLNSEQKKKMSCDILKDKEEVRFGGDAEGEKADIDYKELSHIETVYMNQHYRVGDFVYIESREALYPRIMTIRRFSMENEVPMTVTGCYFYRPNDTYYLGKRKFMEKEVFRTEQCYEVNISQIVGHCAVLFVKQYFKMKPQDIPDNDVYVCESQYNIHQRCFKKIKNWQCATPNIALLPRDPPLARAHVTHVFTSSHDNIAKELDDEDISFLESRSVDVLSDGAEKDGNTYYDQYVFSGTAFKLGDCVYLGSDSGRAHIARINLLWTSSTGEPFFRGNRFLYPEDVEHVPTRLFYKNEVFHSSAEECRQLAKVTGKCFVMHIKDYCSGRPTEISECDIYVCECKHMKLERSLKKLSKGLKKVILSAMVTDDEMFFFRKQLVLHKEPSPLLVSGSKIGNERFHCMEGEIICEEGHVSKDITAVFEDSTPSIEKSAKKKTLSSRRLPSGYIVFAGEIRKSIQIEHPESSFGDISRIVGMKWRSLRKEEKEVFEDRAKKIAGEMLNRQQHEALTETADALHVHRSLSSPLLMTAASSVARVSQPGRCVSSITYRPPSAHPSSGVSNSVQRFTSSAVDVMSSPSCAGKTTTSSMLPPLLPMFVNVKPRSHRILHSEAYMRYIEGLTPDRRTISNLEKMMTVVPENMPTASTTPVQASEWLAQGSGYHNSVIDALWALRDLMLKDTMTLAQNISFEDM